LAKKIILVLVSVLLVVYLLKQVDVREVFRVVWAFPPRYLFAGFAFFLAGHFARAFRFKILLRQHVPFKSLFSITAVQTAASVFMPLRSGEFSLMYLLKREHNVDYAVGAAVIVLAKVLDFLVVATMFFISISTLPTVPPLFRELLPWAGGLFGLTVFSLLLLSRSREIYARMPRFLREGPLTEGRLFENVKKVFKGAEVIRSRKTIFSALFATLLTWSFLYGSNFFVLWGVGLKLTVLEMVFLTTSMSLFANLPIHSPGGFGTMESFWTLILLAMGVSKPEAIATGFASHLVTTAYLLIFMLYGLRLIKLKGQEQA
jgi:uncharacterized protein (TIRG00374 family)